VSVGYHLYADADGARDAISASPPEIVLRVNEEIDLPDDPSKQTLTETTSTRTLGEQTRTLTGRVTLDEDDRTTV